MPYKDPAARTAYRRGYYQANREHENGQRKHAARNTKRWHAPFIGIDGEGGTINGRHEYLLLRAGNHVLETGKPLRSREILRWIANLPQDGIYVGYYFNYDVTMILRDLPPDLITKLFDRAGRTPDGARQPRRVWWGDIGIDYLPNKEFRVCIHTDRTNRTSPRWVVVNDVGSFFQCSFVKALELWDIGSPEIRARIAASKFKRSGFSEITPLTRLYNKKECDLLVELMTRFRDVIDSIGPRPQHWQGPGNLAAAWLRAHNTPTDLSRVPPEVLDRCQRSYYGGWFETYYVGPIRGTVHEYDINSAYPAGMSGLPCLLHGKWVRIERDGKRRNGGIPRPAVRVSHASFYTPRGRLCCLPIRTQPGNIIRPRRGRGWYWGHELDAARRLGVDVTEHESWVYRAACGCQPFDWVADLYYERKRVGKTAKGMALKLALNSLYGKIAQSIGHPTYANPVWASLITSYTRTRILEAAMLTTPEHVLMIATDGIFTDVELPGLPLSDRLGEWDHKTHDGIFLIQPGIYMLPDALPKTRGVPQRMLVEHGRALRKRYAEGRWREPHVVPLQRFMGLRQAHALGKLDQAGQWYTEQREITFRVETKHADTGVWRIPNPYPSVPCESPPFAYRPDPLEGSPDLESVPYGNMIGTWAEQRAWEEEQPEWAPYV